MLQHGSGKFPVHGQIEQHVYRKGKGAGPVEQIGEVLYNRGLIGAVIGVEAIRKAQQEFGRRPLAGEEVRWGLERLDITDARLKELGIGDMIKPLKVTCADHEGSRSARIQQWDGSAWRIISDWYTADESLVDSIVQEVSARYAAQRNITPRECSKEGLSVR
jgi:branched-chain amino acid transport system substrate-binding protein